MLPSIEQRLAQELSAKPNQLTAAVALLAFGRFYLVELTGCFWPVADMLRLAGYH